MKLRLTLSLLGVALASVTALLAFQLPFRVYRSMEAYDDIPLPTDYRQPSEFVFARLMYPQHPFSRFSRRRFGSGDWREGGTSWTQDYPRADRHFAVAMRRLTRIETRSVEQPVNLENGDDVFNWPWMAAGEMGDWYLDENLAGKLRDYLMRGGFLMLDDFWGPEEYGRFEESMHRVFPDRPVVDIEDQDPVFHLVYDLDHRYQVMGEWSLGGRQNYRTAGTVAHWMGVYDDSHRLMVVISFNSDLGDSWEWADEPRYPEKFSALGIRIGVNDVVYDMTH
jgi:hypothetical protein